MPVLNPLHLRRDHYKLRREAAAILEKANAEKRDMSPEENEKFDELCQHVDKLAKQMEAAAAEENEDEGRDEDEEGAEKEGNERAAQRLRDLESRGDRASRGRSTGGMNPKGRDAGEGRDSKQYRGAFGEWMKTGRETRDLALGTTSAGGFLVTPTKLSNDLVIALNNLCFVRGLADVETLTEAANLGVCKITTDVSDADWTAEVPESELTADSSLATGRRDLSPQLLTKLVLVSHKLLQFSSRVESIVNQRLAYKFAVAEEKAFLTGNGSGKPLGLFYASSDGISTGRDTTCASTTLFTADELIDLAYSIPAQYTKSPSFGWIMHRLSVAKCRKFKNGDGYYIWQAGIAMDRPDTLLNFPVYQSEYAPSTYTTGLYVALLGDMKYYKIADVANLEMQRLNERFATKNQVGFLGRRYLDGSPVLEQAFARLKLA